MTASSSKPLYLGAGLQSGGTTLASWCFLQRKDMDGVLDLRPDVLEELPRVDSPYVWAKATIASFSYRELAEFYRWYGYDVRPVLVTRDIRRVYASLSGKFYGIDGTTAEDPPLRMRLYRFLKDWEIFRENDWAIVRYESLVADPESTLRKACSDLGLPWDEAMLSWPKKRSDIADTSIGNQTLIESLAAGGALQAIDPAKAESAVGSIPDAEAAWIAERFAVYNEVNGYDQAQRSAGDGGEYRGPRYVGTRRDNDAKELERTRKAQNRLQRILRHPILGRAVQFWGKFVNRDFSDVWRAD